MAYTFQYFDQVITDIQEAKLWYKEKRDGLDVEFAFAIQEAIELIAKMPTAYTIRYKTIRVAHTKVFPYNIHFYCDELTELIVITAIVHNKRNSNVAQERV